MSARRWIRNLMMVGCGMLVAAPVMAQAPRPPVSPGPDPQGVARYQIIVMEGVLEAAVQHGARVVSRQWQSGMPQITMLSGNARARGFRLDGYGVFFDVDVPAMRQSIMWSWRMLDRDDAGAAAALESLRSLASSVSDPAQRREVEQAIRSIEVRVGAVPSIADAIRAGDPAKSDGRSSTVAPGRPAATDAARAVDAGANPDVAYTDAVKEALIDAMVSYSQRLVIGPDEWLTVAARDASNPRLSGDDPSDIPTIFLRIRGMDLQALHAGRLTRDEARRKVEVREY